MTITPPLTDQALEICAKNYNSTAHGCGRCRLYTACTAPVSPLTWQTLGAWQARINAEAVRLIEAGEA
jgi:hypothetical protein